MGEVKHQVELKTAHSVAIYFEIKILLQIGFFRPELDFVANDDGCAMSRCGMQF